MLKTIRLLVAGLIAMGLSSVAAAQGLDTKKLFFGAGFSQNDPDWAGSDTGTGYQFFGGYTFGQVAPQIHADVEVGYMDTGKMKQEVCYPFVGCVSGEGKAKGLWANGVGRYIAAPNIELIGRAGLDFGDDDGFMYGVGAGYIMNKNAKLRLEYVVRQNINSLEFNFVYQP